MKQTTKHHLTAENGRPIADNENTQTAGVRGAADAEWRGIIIGIA